MAEPDGSPSLTRVAKMDLPTPPSARTGVLPAFDDGFDEIGFQLARNGVAQLVDAARKQAVFVRFSGVRAVVADIKQRVDLGPQLHTGFESVRRCSRLSIRRDNALDCGIEQPPSSHPVFQMQEKLAAAKNAYQRRRKHDRCKQQRRHAR